MEEKEKKTEAQVAIEASKNSLVMFYGKFKDSKLTSPMAGMVASIALFLSLFMSYSTALPGYSYLGNGIIIKIAALSLLVVVYMMYSEFKKELLNKVVLASGVLFIIAIYIMTSNIRSMFISSSIDIVYSLIATYMFIGYHVKFKKES